jgi:hypothetical protein
VPLQKRHQLLDFTTMLSLLIQSAIQVIRFSLRSRQPDKIEAP